MPASSARFIVCEGGVEVTRIFIRVSETGCVAAAPRGDGPPFNAISFVEQHLLFRARRRHAHDDMHIDMGV
jgi:hypothetical protein